MRSKFSDQDRAAIAEQYRDPEVTIAQLADQYQVSVSTMQRLLKDLFSPEDYSLITASKRTRKKSSLPLFATGKVTEAEVSAAPEAPEQVAAAPDPLIEPAMEEEAELAAALQDEFKDHPIPGDPEDDLTDFEEEEEEPEEEEEEDIALGDAVAEDVATWEVLNLDDLDPPEKCYAVIDRFQELTTRPLKDFDHAGILPVSLHHLRTLPLFDSHRVARRFSEVIRRGSSPGYRVIDFPGEWLFMVRSALCERGITHILFDGQVYDLREPEAALP
ncbi:MAG: hypothetical protein Q6K99_02370 [Thermostichales cyanobacterium BF4_bins_65]